MPAHVTKLGPGTVQIGSTGSEVDFECQVTAARVEWSADAEDDVDVLCGEKVPGARTYSSIFGGTILSDIAAPAGEGITEFSWAHKGEQHPFVFVPNTAAGKQVSGTLIVDPITVGGDSGQNMTADFELTIVGDPVLGAAA